MHTHRLSIRLLGSFLAVALVSLGLLVGYAFHQQRVFVDRETQTHLESVVRLLEMAWPPPWTAEQESRLQSLLPEVEARGGIRVTFIAPDGRVVADSEGNPARMENHRDRPEVAQALEGRIGAVRRPSASVGRDFFYVAMPCRAGDALAGVIRAAQPARSLQEVLGRMRRELLVAAGILVGLAFALSYGLARTIIRPLNTLTAVADDYAAGRLDRRAPPQSGRELAQLSDAMNRMAENLDAERRTIDRLLQEQKAIFFGMSEGLLVIDHDEHIVELNQAAAQMLGVDASRVKGRSMLAGVRNLTLQRLVSDALRRPEPVEGDLALHDETGDRFLQVRGSSVRVAGEAPLGVLIVLSDVTRLKRLESIRRDFVANASHELKTPVTSIKGFAETLLGGHADAAETRRFVEIIDRQADQLSSLIDDLLDLTRIEHEQERGKISLQNLPVIEVIDRAVGFCAPEAEQRQIRIEVTGSKTARARIEPSLLERALVNLIENAVKYSEPGRRVEVALEESERDCVVRVSDEGCGIAAENLSRIFERFYRVDKARSRKLGGTGLGLAIVKHVVQAHRGEISVESQLGKGSTFSVRLPRCADANS